MLYPSLFMSVVITAIDVVILLILNYLNMLSMQFICLNTFILLLVVSLSYYIKFGRRIHKIYKVFKNIDMDQYEKDREDIEYLKSVQVRGNTEIAFILKHIQKLIYYTDQLNVQIAEAEKDALTQVYNRLHLEKVIPDYKNYTVCFLDVNNLKKMNDINGHQAGDALLIRATNELLKLQAYADIYRIGGDEFMLVFNNLSLNEVEPIIKTWHASVPRLNKVSDGFVCCFSYGLAQGGILDNFDTIMKRADELMYNMKVETKIRLGEPLTREEREDKK